MSGGHVAVQRIRAEDARVTPAAPPLPLIMLALMAAHLAGMGAFLTVPVLAPAMASETGVPASLAGLHTALVYAGALVTGPLTGPLIRRWGGVRMLQISMVVLGCGIALAALGHPLALAASAILAGMGHGPVTPGGSHLIAAHTPARRRALVFSLKQAGVPLGAMVVAALAPAIALVAGWRASILCMAGIAFLVAIAIQPLRAGLDRDRDRPGASAGLLAVLRESAANLGLLRTDKELARLTLMSCGYGIAQFCFSTFFVAFQVASLGTSLGEAGLRLAIAQAAGVIGRIGWALLADRIGASRVLAACGIGAALAGLALAFAGPDWPGFLVAAAGMVMGATAVGWNGVMLAEAARLAPPGQVGGATAALSFAFGMTMLVAPPAFSGLIGLTGGYGAGFLMCVVATAIGAVAIAGARK
ncbi:MFS transporter [Falsiroseomonas sp. HC035]|uniref:MFS transporter n=1 Tax=Falsiroseomonas sp. HC035 TaxID=3390999 RepID=UPI003D3103F5